jgi:hypothetical protein
MVLVDALERRRCRFGVTWSGGRVCADCVAGTGLGGAAAMGMTPLLAVAVEVGKLVGVVTADPPLAEP